MKLSEMPGSAPLLRARNLCPNPNSSPAIAPRAEQSDRSALLRATENRARNRQENKRFSLKISKQVLLLEVWGFVQVGSVAIMLTGMR